MGTPREFCRERGAIGSGESVSPLAHAVRRLQALALILCLALVTTLVAGVIMNELAGHEPTRRLWIDRGRQVSLLALSLLFLAGLRWARASQRQVGILAATYQLSGALVMSITFFGFEPLLQHTASQLTWLGVMIVLFPVLAPSTPIRTAALGAASAATAPLAFAVGVAMRGDAWPAAQVLVATFLPYGVCAMMGVIAAIVVHGLTRELTAARAAARDMGSYRLIEKLGEGGMGEVWRAEHRLLRRPAAIKLIRPRADRSELPEVLERFEREAQVTSLLRSPNTVSLYDYGAAADGTVYYAMELLEGLDLDQLVRRHGPLPAGRAIHLIVQACEALAEAHADGLIHRDIKPSNLFAARLGVAVDVLKVMDFGLVGLAPWATSDTVKLTTPGHVIGTPSYMAPEQVLDGGKVDTRSDLYALGCVLYWLLTGTPVFEGDSPIRVLMDHAHTTPSAVRTRRSTVPVDLEEVVMACLAKDPGRRPQSALELRARLLGCDASKSWTPEDARGWWMRSVPAPAPHKKPVRDELPETVLVAR